MSPDMEKIMELIGKLREEMLEAHVTRDESFQLNDEIDGLIDIIPF